MHNPNSDDPAYVAATVIMVAGFVAGIITGLFSVLRRPSPSFIFGLSFGALSTLIVVYEYLPKINRGVRKLTRL